MGRSALAPAVDKLSCPTGKARSHIGVAKGKNLSFLIDALRRNELKVSVAILRNGQISDRARIRIELRQVTACLLYTSRCV